MDASPIRCISVVIPVHNEEACLPELLRRLETVCSTLDADDYEIILVDDGSQDRSGALLIEAAKRTDSHAVAVILNRNYRQHAALMAGLQEACGELIITLDADLQNPPEEIPRLVAAASQGFDVVGTVRVNRHDSWFRKLASRIINKTVQRATGVAMHDYGCMLRAFRRPIVDAMLQCPERSTFIPILANMFARHTTEIDVRHDARRHGDSKYTLMHLINLMFDLLTCMSPAPLRLLSLLGGLIAGCGFVFAGGLIVLRLLYGATWGVEGVFPLFTILLIFVGAQFLGLGLIGEYTGRIYTDVRARPRYFVQQVVRSAGKSTQDKKGGDLISLPPVAKARRVNL